MKMLEQVIYQVAEEYIVLNTPSKSKTIELFKNYKPFLRESLPKGEEPLMEVYGSCLDKAVLVDGDKLVEESSEPHFHSKLYTSKDRTHVLEITYFNQKGTVRCSEDWRKIYCSPSLDDKGSALVLDRFIMIAFGLATIPLAMLKVHASVTELNGKALVFMGVSGTGKSTHSKLWREHVEGCTLLNDDEPIVRLMPDNTVRVYGCPWSGSTHCYRDEWAELVAFVHLYQAPENKLTKQIGRFAFDSLYTSVASMRTLGEMNMKLFETVADVLSIVPLYRLDCLPNKEAVALTRSLLD